MEDKLIENEFIFLWVKLGIEEFLLWVRNEVVVFVDFFGDFFFFVYLIGFCLVVIVVVCFFFLFFSNLCFGF